MTKCVIVFAVLVATSACTNGGGNPLAPPAPNSLTFVDLQVSQLAKVAYYNFTFAGPSGTEFTYRLETYRNGTLVLADPKPNEPPHTAMSHGWPQESGGGAAYDGSGDPAGSKYAVRVYISGASPGMRQADFQLQ